MNALIEPLELQESECNAQGWQMAGALDELDPDEPVTNGDRVLAWMVDRICALPAGTAH
jgi:hypothetical protein